MKTIVLILLVVLSAEYMFAQTSDNTSFFHVKIFVNDEHTKSLYRIKKGDLIYLESNPIIPYIFRGGSSVIVRIDDDGLVKINSLASGIILTSKNRKLLSENTLIRYIVITDSKIIDDDLITQLLTLRSPSFYIVFQNCKLTDKDLQKFEPLKSKIKLLGLQNSTLTKCDTTVDLGSIQHYLFIDSKYYPGNLNKVIGNRMPNSLALVNTELSLEDRNYIKSLNSLRELNLRGSNIDDENVSFIEPLYLLNELNLADTSISDRTIERIQRNQSLMTLDISGTKVTDEGLDYLPSLFRLCRLDMRNLKSTELSKGLSEISRLAHLQLLDLSGSRINPKYLRSLYQCSFLQRLVLSSTNLSDREIRYLRNIQMLKELYLDNNNITGDGLKYLSTLPNLRILDLTGNRISGKQQQYLRDLPNLERLILTGNDIDKYGISLFRQLKQLAYLDISNTKVGDDSAEFIIDIPLLNTLVIKDTSFSDLAIAKLKERSPLLNIVH
ncbi:MAG: hypothetical protein JW737_06585 [Acidobacteria bacterium]|nr:hypothetical protein [Acidobacteriota bacterium]